MDKGVSKKNICIWASLGLFFQDKANEAFDLWRADAHLEVLCDYFIEVLFCCYFEWGLSCIEFMGQNS